MAGSIGGFNAHAANLVTAVYIATGQVSAAYNPWVVKSTCFIGPSTKCWEFKLHYFDGSFRPIGRRSLHILYNAKH